MGWLFKCGSTRRNLIEERRKSWERTSGEMLVQSTCLAHCYHGGHSSGVPWPALKRTYTNGGKEVQPTERWIQCDLLQYQRDYGWGYKDKEESCGPYYYSCPLKYPNMVPFDRYGGNVEWREPVVSHHQRITEKQRQKAASKA
jgi:hypothetical protein